MRDKLKRSNIWTFIPRFETFIVSVLVMVAGLAGGKYALFRYSLERMLERHRLVTCYLAPLPLLKWDVLYALPSVAEALVILVLAGLFGVKSRISQARRQLLQRLLDEKRFPEDVARQLRDQTDIEE